MCMYVYVYVRFVQYITSDSIYNIILSLLHMCILIYTCLYVSSNELELGVPGTHVSPARAFSEN